MKLFNFGNKKDTTPLLAIEILFHREAFNLPESGVVYADNVGLGLKNYPVRFAFVNCDTLPRLDRVTFNHICDCAEAKGFNVVGMRSYGDMRYVAPPVTQEQVKAAFVNQNTTAPGQATRPITASV